MRRALLIAGIAVLVVVASVALAARWLLNPDTVRAALEAQASAAIGHPVRIASVDWAVSMRPRLALSGVRVGEPPALTVDRVDLTTGLPALFSKRVEAAAIVVSGSQVTLPLPIMFGASTGSSPVSSDDRGSAAFTVTSIDRISLENIDLGAEGRHLRLDAESSLSADRLEVSSLRLRSAVTSVTGRGEMTSLAERRGSFALTADPLDLDELLAIASGLSGPPGAATLPARTGAAPPLDVSVDIKAPRGRVVGADFAALIASLRMSRGGVTLDHFTTTIFDGKVAGRVQLDTTASPPAASLSAEIDGVDAARLAAFAGSAGVLTGRLGGHVSLRARGVTPETFFRTATGRATVVITDGTLPGLDLVSPVILAFGKPDPSKAAAPSREFSRLGGTFALAEGVLRSDDLTMSSRDVDLSGRGTLRVAGAVTDVRADLLLSESLSAQAGRDLYRYARQGSRIVLPATVNGPLASPSVSLDLAAAAERAITNELEDQVRKALERLRKR